MTAIAITHHAVDRFVERFAPEMSHDEARAHLEAKAPGAARLATRTVLGQEQWKIEGPACVLVVKRDRGGAAVVVTVLPDPERFAWRLTEGEEEILREWAERVATPAPRPAKGPRPGPPSPPKRPSMPAKSHPAYEAMVSQAEAAKKRQEEQTKRYQDAQGREIGRLKVALAAALRALVGAAANGDAAAFAALEEVQAQEPGYLTEAFLRGAKPKHLDAENERRNVAIHCDHGYNSNHDNAPAPDGGEGLEGGVG